MLAQNAKKADNMCVIKIWRVTEKMKYDFDKYIDRHGTGCEKWDGMKEAYGTNDLLAMWVADMDFKAPPEVLDALRARLDEGVLGYPVASPSAVRAVRGWEKKRHGWDFPASAVSWAPGVVTGLAFAVEALTKPGDGIIIQTPIYPPFYRTVREAGRIIVENPLINKNGRFTMDIKGLEKLVTPTCRMLLFCSPHNPTARVWTKEELTALADLAKRRDMIIVVDEIHHDLIFSDAVHTCFASLSKDAAQRTLTFIAPSKTFNIAGLKASVAVIENKRYKACYDSVAEKYHQSELNMMGLTAMETAYSKCGPWLDQLMEYLEGNRDYLEKFLKKNMPKAVMGHPEGTYIFWIDFRGYGLNEKSLQELLVKKAHVALNSGISFGAAGDGFARINIGTTRAQLKEGLERIAAALKTLDR